MTDKDRCLSRALDLLKEKVNFWDGVSGGEQYAFKTAFAILEAAMNKDWEALNQFSSGDDPTKPIIHQVRFRPIGEEAWQGGIYINNNLEDAYIICGCCGHTYELYDVDEYYFYDNWVDLSEDIMGNDSPNLIP